jgi:hypothetical protein
MAVPAAERWGRVAMKAADGLMAVATVGRGGAVRRTSSGPVSGAGRRPGSNQTHHGEGRAVVLDGGEGGWAARGAGWR